MTMINVVARDFGRYYDVYVVREAVDGRLVQTILDGPQEDGAQLFRDVEYDISERMDEKKVSFSIPHSWIGPLVDALSNNVPTKVDAALLKTLEVERARVDKLIDYVVADIPFDPPTE
jgi:hypothetical protein